MGMELGRPLWYGWLNGWKELEISMLNDGKETVVQSKPTLETLCSVVLMGLGSKPVAQNPTHQDVERFG